MTRHVKWANNIAKEPYEPVSELVHGVWRTGARIYCVRCGAVKVIWNQVTMPLAMVTKTFRARGWDTRRSICPACVERQRGTNGDDANKKGEMENLEDMEKKRAFRPLSNAVLRKSRDEMKESLFRIVELARAGEVKQCESIALETLCRWT